MNQAMQSFLLKTICCILIINVTFCSSCFNSVCKARCYFRHRGFDFGYCDEGACKCIPPVIYVFDGIGRDLSDEYINNSLVNNNVIQKSLKTKPNQEDNRDIGIVFKLPNKTDVDGNKKKPSMNNIKPNSPIKAQIPKGEPLKKIPDPARDEEPDNSDSSSGSYSGSYSDSYESQEDDNTNNVDAVVYNFDSTICEPTQTVKHIITECQKYEDTRKKYDISQQIGEALGPDTQSISNILQLIKEIQLYNLI